MAVTNRLEQLIINTTVVCAASPEVKCVSPVLKFDYNFGESAARLWVHDHGTQQMIRGDPILPRRFDENSGDGAKVQVIGRE